MPRRELRSLLWLLAVAVCGATAAPRAALAQAAPRDVAAWETDPSGHSRAVQPRDNSPLQDKELLAWAAERTAQRDKRSQLPPHACIDCFLVVGVKTRVVRGFEARQSIRATWGSQASTHDSAIRVVFLACDLDAAQERDLNASQQAIALEKQVYGDLLTHELGGCVDGYGRLVDKVLGFFHWAVSHHPAAPFVMVADDDVYVRLDHVTKILKQPVTPRSRYYAGQVLTFQHRRAIIPVRDRVSKYYLSSEHYPMSTFPPFAIGAHYLLSRDLVQFLARNRNDLRGVGTLEDVSVGFWLKSLLHINVTDIPLFRCLAHSLCSNTFASYGELSRASVQQIHANLARGMAFCHGFSFTSWSAPEVQALSLPSLPPRRDTTYQWELHVCPLTRALRISTTIHLRKPLKPLSLPTEVFIPSRETLNTFCDRIDDTADRLHQRLPLMLCADLVNQLHNFLRSHPLHKTALLALTRYNLPPVAVPAAYISVWITHRVLRWRTFVEALVTEIYPDVQIYVVENITAPNPVVLRNVDLAVLSASEFAQLVDLSPSSRRMVFTEENKELSFTQLPDQGEYHRTILFTDRFQPDQTTYEHTYIPLVSLVFSDSVKHSPLALLQASSERIPSFHPVDVFATPHCNRRVTALLAQLDERHHLDCDYESSGTDRIGTGETSPETLFAFDAEVARYSRSRFVLAFEMSQDLPGYVAGTIAAAFLAGSVPVYDGDGTAVSRLFNPKAFINCGRFRSREDCGDNVMKVYRSPMLYAEMRSEPPVVNETAFFELFSWHPDVLRWSKFNPVQQESIATRLRETMNRI